MTISILDNDHNIVSKSKNLRGIRTFSSKHAIAIVELNSFLIDNSGRLTVRFDGGFYAIADFASFTVLKRFVRRWRNAQGAALLIDGNRRGVVTPTNKGLQ